MTATEAEAPPADALCGWAHVELARLTTAAGLLGRFGRRWKARADGCRSRGERERAAVIDDMLGELAEILARPGRGAGSHADHLTAAQWHLNRYVAATRPRPPA